VNTREREIYKYIFALIYNSVQNHPISKCCAPACLCCTCFFPQRNNKGFFLPSSSDAIVQLLLFYVCQNLGQDFKLSSGKIPTLSAPSGRKRILSFVPVPCTAFPIWPLEPILPQCAVFQFPHSKYFASNILFWNNIFFSFLLIRVFSTFASNVLFHFHQNSFDICIYFFISNSQSIFQCCFQCVIWFSLIKRSRFQYIFFLAKYRRPYLD